MMRSLLQTVGGVALSLLLPHISAAQSIAEEWNAIREAYGQATSLTFDQTYHLYASRTSTEPVEELAGEVRKSDQCLYQKVGPIQTMETTTYFFKIDHDQREMVVLGRNSGESSLQALPTEGLDSLLENVADVKRSVTGANEVKYTLSGIPGNGMIAGYELYFNTQTNWVTRLVLYYRSANGWIETDEADSPRLEITYMNYRTQEPVSCEELDYTNYMTYDHGNWRPVSAYQSYHVINQLLNAEL